VELAISLDSPVLFEKLLAGSRVDEVDEAECFVAGPYYSSLFPLFRTPTSSSRYEREDQQRNLDVGFLKLLQAAPQIASHKINSHI
jgi:hypothetical protein